LWPYRAYPAYPLSIRARKFDLIGIQFGPPRSTGRNWSGCLDAVADLGNLWREMNAEELAQINDSDHVLNGIAYDAKSGDFYLTGKRWKTIFRGRFVEAR